MALPITFLSDYGTEDEFAGVCRAVIARIAPEAQVIDLTHAVSRHAVRRGAMVLANSIPYAPVGVHLAVVDPGVGTPRRAIAVRSVDGRLFVGPDNGLLQPALEGSGGPSEAVDVTLSERRLEPVSATFHGRDVFAPIAAHLANGVALAELGEPLDPSALETIELSRAEVAEGRAVTHVVHADRFGNVALDLAADQVPGSGMRLGHPLWVEAAGVRTEATYAHTFADVPEGALILYLDSTATLALAVNRGAATERLGLSEGDEVVLTPA